MKNGEKPIANPVVVLREEFDDWAVLFDPDSGNAFGLSPTGVYLWKHLDGKHSIDDMLEALRRDGEDVPQEAGEHLAAFVEELTAHGLAGYDVEQGHDDRGRLRYCPTCAGTMAFNYEAPTLINLSGEQAAGACCYSGTGATGPEGCCHDGTCGRPAGGCWSGACADNYCGTGTYAYTGCRLGCEGTANDSACGGGSCVGSYSTVCHCSGGS